MGRWSVTMNWWVGLGPAWYKQSSVSALVTPWQPSLTQLWSCLSDPTLILFVWPNSDLVCLTHLYASNLVEVSIQLICAYCHCSPLSGSSVSNISSVLVFSFPPWTFSELTEQVARDCCLLTSFWSLSTLPVGCSHVLILKQDSITSHQK